jgi:glycosyltransferase involved in cell wall biosynthesis
LDTDDELIVVDDSSTDNSIEISRKYTVHVITRKQRSGPARARNEGAKIAKGKFLYFVDSDTMLSDDNIRLLKSHLQKNPKIKVIQSLWSPKPLDEGFSARFLALRAYYVTDIDNFPKNKNNRVTSWFYAANSAIDRRLFLSIGGFNTKYTSPGGEEYEFGHRLREKYPIYDYNDLIVYHTFGTIRTRIKELFFRTSRWSKLLISGKKFESSQATFSHTAASFFGFCALISFPLLLTGRLRYSLIFFAFECGVLLYRIKFIRLMQSAENNWFAFKGIIAEHILLAATALGGGIGLLQSYFSFHWLSKRTV